MVQTNTALPAEGTALRLTLDTLASIGTWVPPREVADRVDSINSSHVASNLAMLAKRGLVLTRGERGERVYRVAVSVPEALPPEPEPKPEPNRWATAIPPMVIPKPEKVDVLAALNLKLRSVRARADEIQAQIAKLDEEMGRIADTEKRLEQARSLLDGIKFDG